MKMKKNVLIGISCALLAVFVLVIALMWLPDVNGPVDPTDGPGLQNPTGPNVTSPDGTTGPGDGTNPGDDTVPGGETDPTVPGTDPTNPTEPLPTYPNPDLYPTEPTEPGPTYPTNPDTGETVPVNPTEPSKPPVNPDIDIGDYTPGNITCDVWNSWTNEQKQEFYMSFDWGSLTQDEAYNLNIVTVYNGYTCGWENHYCCSDADHEAMLEEMARGCYYCGDTECPSFYARNENGFTVTDVTHCPAYSEKSDPTKYCQTCGHRCAAPWISGETYCCKTNTDGTPCPWCGEERMAGECHPCVKP